MAQISAVEILKELKNPTIDPVALQRLRDRIEDEVSNDAERTTVFEGVAQELQTLNATEKTLVQNNLRALETRTTHATARKSLDALKIAVNSVPAAAPVAPVAVPAAPVQPEGLGTSVGNSLERVADTVLPERMTANMSRNQKIAAVAVGTLGIAVAIAAFWKGWKGVKKTLIWGGAGIAGALGLKWLADKISLAGGLKAAGQKVLDEANQKLKEARYLAFPWEKYGLKRKEYNQACAVYADKKEAGADEIRNRFFGGKNSPEFELFMKDRREEAAETETDEHGVEWVPVTQAFGNYMRAINEALLPLRDFLAKNAEGIVVIGGLSLAVSPRLRKAVLGGATMSKDGIIELLQFFGGMVTKHPILSALSATAALYGVTNGKVPKDPVQLQKFMVVKMNETGAALPGIPDEDWKMLAGLMQGSADAFDTLSSETKRILNIAGRTTLEAISLSPTELIQNKNEAGLRAFLRFVEALSISHRELAPKFLTIKSFVEGMKYPLQKNDIEKLITMAAEFNVMIDKEGGLFVYRIQDENAVWHTKSLCIDPSISIDEQASYARVFILDHDDPQEALNQFGQPLRQAREWAQYVFFKDVKTEKEAAEKLEGELNSGGVIMVRSGIAYLCLAGQGGLKQYVIAPFEVVRHLFAASTGKFSATEAALDYAEGLLPVYIFGLTATLSQARFAEAFGFKLILRTAAYPVSGTMMTTKVVSRSIIAPLWNNIRDGRKWYAGVLEDPRMIVQSGLQERIARWSGILQRKIIPGATIKEIGYLNRRIAFLHEAKKLIAQSRFSFSDTRYLEAARNVLLQSEMKVIPDLAKLASEGTGLIDEEIRLLGEEMRQLRTTSKGIKELLASKTPLHAVLNAANTADDFDEIAKAYKAMKPVQQADELKGLLNAHSVEAVRGIGLGESLDDVVKAAGSLDETVRLARVKELLIIGEAPEELVRLGASADDVLKAAERCGAAIADDVLESARALVTPKVPAGLPGTGPAPRPVAPSLERAPIAIEGKLAEMRKGFTGPAADVFDEAVKEARALGLISNADECAELFKSHAVIEVLRSGSTEVKTAMSTIAKGEGAIVKAQSIAHYVLELGSGAKGNLVSAQLLERVASVPPNRAAIIGKIFQRAPKLSNVAPEYLVKQFDAIGAHPKLFAGAVALEIAGVVFDYMELDAVRSHINKVTESVTTMLENAKLPNGKSAFIKTGSGDKIVYTHATAPGLQIDMSTMVKENLESLDDAAIINLATSSASLATTLLAPSIALGPAGLVVAGCVIAVRVGTSIMDAKAKGDLIRSLPLPILAKLGFAGATRGGGEFEWLEQSSNWMAAAGEQERGEIRKRAYLAMFFQEFGALQQKFPELRDAVQGGKDDFEFYSEKGEFYKEHFPNVVQPYISMRIMDASNGNSNLNWGQLRQQAIKSEWDEWKGMVGLYADNVDKAVVGRILKESAWVYAAHIKEVHWHKKRVENQDRYNASETAWQQYGVIDDPTKIGSSARAQILRSQLQTELKQGSGGTLLGLTMNSFDASMYRGPYASQVSEMIRKQYAAFEEELGETGTRVTAVNAGLFTLALPDGIFPNRKERTVRLSNFSDLFIDTVEVIPGTDKKARYRKILKERERIQALVTFDYKNALSATFTEDKYNALLDYKKLILASPEFDPDGEVTNAISALPQAGWSMLRNGGNPAVIQRIDNALKRQGLRMKARYFVYFPDEKVAPNDESHTTLATFGARADVRSFPDTGSFSNAYDDVARKNIDLINDHLRHLSSTKMMVPNAGGQYYTREGHAGKYYPQENGTLYYIPDDATKSHKIWALTDDRKSWNWREVREGDRLHAVNPRFERELYVRLEGTGGTFRFEAKGASGEYPIPGGMLRYEESGGMVRWNIEGTGQKPHKYYCFHKNYLNIDQPGDWIEVTKVPDLVHTMNPGGTQFFYPQVFMDLTLTLRDGTEIKVASGERGGLDAMKPYVDFQRGTMPNYAGFDYRNGSWQKNAPSSDGVNGWLMTIKSEKREEIDRIEFTSRMSTVHGRKDILVIPAANVPAGQPDPAIEQKRRNDILRAVLKTDPTIHRMNSGMYHDDVSTCSYWFENSGEFKRSWGIRNDEYVSPAVFRDGAWAELSDPLRDSHIADMNERKAKRLQREKERGS